MKLHDLIEELKDLYEEYGDLEVVQETEALPAPLENCYKVVLGASIVAVCGRYYVEIF